MLFGNHAKVNLQEKVCSIKEIKDIIVMIF